MWLIFNPAIKQITDDDNERSNINLGFLDNTDDEGDEVFENDSNRSASPTPPQYSPICSDESDSEVDEEEQEQDGDKLNDDEEEELREVVNISSDNCETSSSNYFKIE